MRKALIGAVAVFATLAAAPAFASSTASVGVYARVPQSCKFSDGDETKTALLSNAEPLYSGKVSYTCNFAGAFSVSLSSMNGGLVNSLNPNQIIDYQIYFGNEAIGSPANWAYANAYTGENNHFSVNSNEENGVTGASLGVYLPSTLKSAGSYSDVVIISLTPEYRDEN